MPNEIIVRPRAGLLERFGAAVKAVVPFSSYGGNSYGYGPLNGLYDRGLMNGSSPGATYDYATAAGNLLENSVVAACVDAIAQALADAPVILEERDGDDWHPNHDHPVVDLLRQPNGFYGASHLWHATTASECTTGNGFWRIVKAKSTKQPAELWWEQSVGIQFDAEHFITRYILYVDGKPIPVENDDIIHFRHALNPQNPRLGWTPLSTVMRQIAGDNLAATYHGALLRNSGVPSLLVSPKQGDTQTPTTVLTPDQVQDLMQKLMAKLTGEGAGKIAGSSLPVSIDKMAYSPDEMAIDKLINYYTTRICAALRVPPMVAGFDDQSRTYCLPAKARVWTPSGPQFISDVVPGQIVWSFVDGALEPRRVIRAGMTGHKTLYEVRTKNRVLRATGNHPVLIRKAGRLGGGNNEAKRVGYEWKRVDELKRGDSVVQPKSLPDMGGDTLPDGTLARPEFIQFLGAMIGDGNLHHTGRILMSVPIDDRVGPFYRRLAAALFSKESTGRVCERRNSFELSSLSDVIYMTALGFAKTAHTKRIPGWVYGLSRELRLRFLAGIVDTDGSVDKRGALSMDFCNPDLCADVRDLLISVGIQCCNIYKTTVPAERLRRHLPNKFNHELYYLYTCVASSAVQVAEIPFVDALYRERVEANATRFKGDGLDAYKTDLSSDLGFYSIVSIKELESEDVFDLEVEGGHSFVADGVVVHNSNYGEAIQDFWQRTIIPMQNRHANELNTQLLPLFGLDPADYRIGYDYSNVEVLQEDENAKVTTWTTAYEKKVVDLNEARVKLGFDKDAKYVGVFYSAPAAPGGGEPPETATGADKENGTVAANGKPADADAAKTITLNGHEVHFMNGQQPETETKADGIDPTDESLPWTDEQLAAATEFTEDDVKFALGSSTPEMRALLRTQPNANGDT